MNNIVLDIKNLNIEYKNNKILNNINVKILKNQFTAIIGESGSGKSTLVLSILQLLHKNLQIKPRSEIIYDNINLLELDNISINQIRGNQISIILQDCMNSLNPSIKVIDLLKEVLLLHKPELNYIEISKIIKDLLNKLNIKYINRVLESYPHQLSGGIMQRIIIALSVICNPKLIIADEPSSSLDTQSQYKVMQMLKELITKFNTSILLITHSMGLALEFADKVIIMYKGHIIEYGFTRDIFTNPIHPYTYTLLKSSPSLYKPINSVKNVNKYYDNISRNNNRIIKGCKLHESCKMKIDICEKEIPQLKSNKFAHYYACFNPINLKSHT